MKLRFKKNSKIAKNIRRTKVFRMEVDDEKIFNKFFDFPSPKNTPVWIVLSPRPVPASYPVLIIDDQVVINNDVYETSSLHSFCTLIKAYLRIEYRSND